jgi:hypothetical protein
MARIVHVIHDQTGKIVAASDSKNHARPVNMEGLTTGEFEVPAQFADKAVREYMHYLRVDVASRCLKEK